MVGNITDSNWLVKNAEKEDVDMCKAEREWEREIENRGRQEGLSQGIEKGLSQGIERGQSETIKAFAKTMSVEDIACALDKTPTEIEVILKN